LIETKTACYLIDSGTHGSEEIIEQAIRNAGREPKEVKGVFLTHAHSGHLGTAAYFREKYGATLYIPIFIDVKDTKESLSGVRMLAEVTKNATVYLVWDCIYRGKDIAVKLVEAAPAVYKTSRVL